MWHFNSFNKSSFWTAVKITVSFYGIINWAAARSRTPSVHSLQTAETNTNASDFCTGAASEPHRLIFLPDAPVSLCISLEGALSDSHLGRVFLRWKPLRMSARSWSMMQTSSCGTTTLRTDRKHISIRAEGKTAAFLGYKYW